MFCDGFGTILENNCMPCMIKVFRFRGPSVLADMLYLFFVKSLLLPTRSSRHGRNALTCLHLKSTRYTIHSKIYPIPPLKATITPILDATRRQSAPAATPREALPPLPRSFPRALVLCLC